MRPHRNGVLVLSLLLGGCGGGAGGGSTGSAAGSRASMPAATYWVYVGAESADLIHRIRFGPDGAVVEKTTPVGEIAVEVEGPHGLVASRDRRHLYMTTAHGVPDGKLWKFEIGPDTLVAPPVGLGFFPASLDLTSDGLYALVVNFNLHGDMVPSSVSVVYTPDLTEVARVETCTMPHGSRVHPRGVMHYSTCMMDDQLVEIDTRNFQVARRFGLASGNDGPITMAGHSRHDDSGEGYEPRCSPTWAQPSADGNRIFVACNKSDEVVEIAFDEWVVVRRIPTDRGPYNLDITPDGRLLVVTLKQGAGVQFFDVESGRSMGLARSSTTVTHGVAVSPDSRYAFVSVEGVGAEPGKVDIYDLATFTRVASVPVGQQASGITFWKMKP